MLATPPELARSALDAAPDAIVIINSAGTVRYANRQVSALFGYAPGEVVGQAVEQLLPERLRARHVQHRTCYMAQPRTRPMGHGLALFGLRQDGTEFPVEISLSPLEYNGERLVAAAIRDVTDRRRIEAELMLAREASEQARQAADEAREAAHRASLEKSRFLAAASHDLRQPLQTLALLNGTLRRMAREPDIAAAVAQQAQAIGAVSRLVNALLDISKLESGAVTPEPADFNIASLFAELERDFSDVARAKGLALQVDPCSVSVHSDPSLIEQILRNLVSNAIKYTRQGWVRLRCLPERARVRIEILDTGIGIPADELPHIYEEFYQAARPSAARDGYGLGLAIVQRLVKLLQLGLDVSSEVGKGSTFALLIPASPGASAAAPPRSPDAPPGSLQAHRARVLLVEDEPGVRDATSLLLKVEGYAVTAVASLEEALAQADLQGSFDLIMADYHLRNGETGIQVIRAVRERLGRPLKAVLITGDTSSTVKDLPADLDLSVTSKPVNADALLALLGTLTMR